MSGKRVDLKKIINFMVSSGKHIFAPENRFFQLLPAILTAIGIAACAAIKYNLTSQLVFSSILDASASEFGYLAFKHDLIIFLIAFSCYWIAAEVPWYVPSVILRFISITSVLPYVIDVFVLRYFSIRLEFNEIYKFSSEWDSARNFIAQAFPGGLLFPVLAGAGTIALIIYFIFVRVVPPVNRTRFALSLPFAAIIVLYLVGDSIPYVHAWTYKNVYEINARQGIAVPFSDDYIQKTLNRDENPLWDQNACTPGLRKKPNVIILLFESLSMHHSEYFSGMPTVCGQFDRIARENTAYTNFYSNGFTTESAMISLLTGRHLFPPVAEYKGAGWAFSFAHQGFYGREGSLPAMFDDDGYFTAFITSGDLGFLDKGSWLKSLGFEHIEGAESPFYRRWPRFHFNAAPDSALYTRAMQILKPLEDRGPYMLVIETVSTHQPFINPVNGKRNEADAFTFADTMLGKFYDALKRHGYFDSGILVILGDHRAMTPIRREETEKFGRAAASRVPMVIVWNDGRPPRRIDAPAQEADFITSFQYLISDASCTGPLHGNFIVEPAVAPEFILFPRGDDRDIVDVYTGTTQAAVRITGDDTAFISGEVPYADELIHHIAKERLLISEWKIAGDN